MPRTALLAALALLLGCSSTTEAPAPAPLPPAELPAEAPPLLVLPSSVTTTALPAGPRLRMDAQGLHLGDAVLVGLVDGAFPPDAVRGRRVMALQQALLGTQPARLVLELGATEPFALLRTLLFTAGISGVEEVVVAVQGPGGQLAGIPMSLPRLSREPSGGLQAPPKPAVRLQLGPDSLARRQGEELLAVAGPAELEVALAALADPTGDLHIDVAATTSLQRLVSTWDAARGDPATPRFARLVVDGEGL